MMMMMLLLLMMSMMTKTRKMMAMMFYLTQTRLAKHITEKDDIRQHTRRKSFHRMMIRTRKVISTGGAIEVA